ncbi:MULTISPECIES: permease-like cell division protein FtsX [Nesterenkonia]|uniref:Cell division protein FtsX n=2 Tax=Nesterenkonia TaxID=57494 RepID=A0A0W8IGY7_9MICC|nr:MULTISPECIES: permease-like cell division protein FtsX [Nesterenkonia]KUG59008.1 cell division protein FtsX [Nesterenkonia jeotgali]MBA8921179.1 cell division transport system permease protein [Nesterenkonia jeotgali]NYJ17267.1 cell division transport system permease protein [Nesterenkonia sandarakina]
MNRLLYMLSETFSSLRRNVAMVASVILVTFISLTFVGSAALMQTQVSQMTDDFYDRLELSVFLCTENSPQSACPTGAVSADQRDSLEHTLSDGAASQYVASYRHETQQEALDDLLESRGESSQTASLTASDMPESYRVLLEDPEEFPVVTELFGSAPGVESVADQQEVLDQIFGILNGLTLVALIIAGVMIVCALLLVATTIRLSAFSRRRETGIMRLVGASKSMIRMPFVFEGVIAALLGGLLACAATWVVAEFVLGQWMAQQVPSIRFIDSGQSWVIMPGLLGIAVVLAIIASWVTVRRYLRV